MSNDDTAGFRHAGEISLTSDQLVTIETVRQALDQLMTKLDRVQAQWQQRHLQLSHTVQFGELEDAMKTVSVNSLRPRQHGRHFPDDIFKCIFLNESA